MATECDGSKRGGGPERGELDAAIVQVFTHEVRPSDLVLYREGLHWVKHPELMIPQGEPIPFLSFDDECFYRQWALDMGQENVVLETVFECSSAAGIVSAVNATMGVALLTALISGHCGAKHPSSQRDHHTFSKVGQIQHFRVVTPVGPDAVAVILMSGCG